MNQVCFWKSKLIIEMAGSERICFGLSSRMGTKMFGGEPKKFCELVEKINRSLVLNIFIHSLFINYIEDTSFNSGHNKLINYNLVQGLTASFGVSTLSITIIPWVF